MTIGGDLHICETCDVKHYDNCPTCFGFGVRPRTVDGDPIPIPAGEPPGAVEGINYLPCPACKSTPAGIPVDG